MESSRGRGSRTSWRGRRRGRTSQKREEDKSTSIASFDNSIQSSAEQIARRKSKFGVSSTQPANKVKLEDEFGLLSRGEDTRLRDDPKARKTYFERVKQEFANYCWGNNLVKEDEDLKYLLETIDYGTEDQLRKSEDNDKSGDLSGTKGNTESLDSITMALRKLREAALSVKCSSENIKIALFSLRFELEETVTVSVFHSLCVLEDPFSAFEVWHKYTPQCTSLKNFIIYWINKDYINWLTCYGLQPSGVAHCMVQIGNKTMIQTAFKIIGAAYHKFDYKQLGICLGMEPEDLISIYNCPWPVVTEGEKGYEKRTFVIRGPAKTAKVRNENQTTV